MMENPYVLEWTVRERHRELRKLAALRRATSPAARPARVGRVAGAALVRFGLFLNGDAYRCPGVAVPE